MHGGGAALEYMDRQEAEIRSGLMGRAIGVTRVHDRLILSMPSMVGFDTGQSRLRPDVLPVLDTIADVLVRYANTAVEVAGHTDSRGSAEYNQLLSEQRALSVMAFLVRHGVVAGRVSAQGFGESMPVADNSYTEGRQANRRVELALYPVAAPQANW